MSAPALLRRLLTQTLQLLHTLLIDLRGLTTMARLSSRLTTHSFGATTAEALRVCPTGALRNDPGSVAATPLLVWASTPRARPL